MTKQGGFKRAARTKARESGQRYSAVRAEMERKNLSARIWAQVEHGSLKHHLEQTYGISVTGLTAFDGDHPGTIRVDVEGGEPWMARLFSSSARPVARAHGDAEILGFLHEQDYPAERLAHAEPVSVLDGRPVLVTMFVQGTRPRGFAEELAVAGDLLGRLHTLPAAGGAMSRDGGAFDHDPVHEGRPSMDLKAAANFLDVVEDKVAAGGRASYEAFRREVAEADTLDGLPECFTHANFGPFNMVRDGDRYTVVGWCGAGTAPRLASVGWVLQSTHGDMENLDAFCAAYRQHVRLTDEELERLPGAVLLRQRYLAAWYYWSSVVTGYQPSGGEGWWPNAKLTEAIVSRARPVLT